jgi:hypothetical protein
MSRPATIGIPSTSRKPRDIPTTHASYSRAAGSPVADSASCDPGRAAHRSQTQCVLRPSICRPSVGARTPTFARGHRDAGRSNESSVTPARNEAGIVVAPMLDSANEHSGVDEKEKADRDLNRQQTPSQRPAGPRSCRPIVGRLENRRNVLARREQLERARTPGRSPRRHRVP